MLKELLNNPSIIIDSIDDLVNFMRSTKNNISLVSNKYELSWQLLQNSDENNFKSIFQILKDGIFNITDLHNGKMIGVGYSGHFEEIIKANQHLNLHLSREQYFGSSINILYSITFINTLKEKIDSIVIILFESGLQNFWKSLRDYNPINLVKIEDNETITIEDIRGLMMLMAIIHFSVILILIIEFGTILIFKS